MTDASQTTPWWALRYEALAALDPALAGPTDDRADAEVAFVHGLLELDAARILDVGAGVGAHAVRCAEAGHHVTALDLSPRLLRLGRERWEAMGGAPGGPTWMPGDMRWLPAGSPVDVVLMLDSFGYFDDEADHARVLAAVAQHLRPGGQFVMSVGNPYHWSGRARVVHSAPGALADGLDVVRSFRFDALRGRLEERTLCFGGAGRTEVPASSVRLYTPVELEAMLAGAGFAEIEIHGSEGFAVPDEPQPLHATDSVTLWVHARL